MAKLIEFVSKDCPACNHQKKTQVMEKLSKAFPDLDCERVDVDKRGDLADEHKIKAIPTYVLLDDEGEELFKKSGGMPLKKLEGLVTEALADEPDEEDENDE